MSFSELENEKKKKEKKKKGKNAFYGIKANQSATEELRSIQRQAYAGMIGGKEGERRKGGGKKGGEKEEKNAGIMICFIFNQFRRLSMRTAWEYPCGERGKRKGGKEGEKKENKQLTLSHPEWFIAPQRSLPAEEGRGRGERTCHVYNIY